MKTHSSWEDFTRDFGDAVGGVFIGYGAATGKIIFPVIGVLLILMSIYLRFYHKKNN